MRLAPSRASLRRKPMNLQSRCRSVSWDRRHQVTADMPTLIGASAVMGRQVEGVRWVRQVLGGIWRTWSVSRCDPNKRTESYTADAIP